MFSKSSKGGRVKSRWAKQTVEMFIVSWSMQETMPLGCERIQTRRLGCGEAQRPEVAQDAQCGLGVRGGKPEGKKRPG